jgi:uncharacterized membrane protein (UPF0127 family)
MLVAQSEEELFIKLEEKYKDVKHDIKEQASVFRDIRDSRSERVPWLERTGFPSHLVSLNDDQIKSSYELPPKKETDAAADTQSGRDTGVRGGTIRNPPGLLFVNEAQRRMGILMTQHSLILLQCYLHTA